MQKYQCEYCKREYEAQLDMAKCIIDCSEKKRREEGKKRQEMLIKRLIERKNKITDMITRRNKFTILINEEINNEIQLYAKDYKEVSRLYGYDGCSLKEFRKFVESLFRQ